MRLFVAIYLPEGLRDVVWGAGDAIKGSWKREPPEKLHVTLKFVGEVDEKRFELIDRTLREIRYPPFTIEVAGVGAFPSRDRPRVLWVGASGRGLYDLNRIIEDRLHELGIPRDEREFVPHVTLGRTKGAVDAERFFERYEGKYFGSFEAREFVLVKSVLKPTGSEYYIVRRYPLVQD